MTAKKSKMKHTTILAAICVLAIGVMIYTAGSAEAYSLQDGFYVTARPEAALSSLSGHTVTVDTEKQAIEITDMTSGNALKVKYDVKKSWKHGTVVELNSDRLGGELRFSVLKNGDIQFLNECQGLKWNIQEGEVFQKVKK